MSSHRIVLSVYALLCIGLFFLSCKDISFVQGGDSSFQFKITVKDTIGNPIHGLRVSVSERLSIEGQPQLKTINIPHRLNKEENILAASSLHFVIAANTSVLLTAQSLRSVEIDTLTSGVKRPGAYNVTWGLPFGTPSGVYKILLSAINDTIRFHDSIYAVFHNPDPDQNVVGWTSQSGIFELTDYLALFPNNFDIPPFTYTSSSGPDSLGTFTYTHFVTVVLNDTSTHHQQAYILCVDKQKNTFDLQWNPLNVPLGSIRTNFPMSTRPISVQADTVSIQIPLEFKLFQNYPNPFN